MNQSFSNKVLKLGFEQQIKTLFSKTIEEELFATSNKWIAFAYYEDGKYYFSDNGDLVETFDIPDVDLLFMLDEINREIKNFGCYLNDSKIVKEIDLDNIESDFKNFIFAVLCVDKMYKNITL